MISDGDWNIYTPNVNQFDDIGEMKKPQSALDRLGTSNRSEFLADSHVMISPVLVSVNASSEADPPTSRNVAVTHLPIDGNVDA